MQNNWIKVTDRLPENNSDILISDGKIIGIGYSEDSEIYFNDEYYLDEIIITHWMPLPEPPEQEETK